METEPPYICLRYFYTPICHLEPKIRIKNRYAVSNQLYESFNQPMRKEETKRPFIYDVPG